MEFSWNQFFILTQPFSDVPSFSKISQHPGSNQQPGKPLSFKIGLKDTSFHIFLNSFGFYPSPLVEFSLTCIFHHVWEKIFNLWCSYYWKKLRKIL